MPHTSQIDGERNLKKPIRWLTKRSLLSSRSELEEMLKNAGFTMDDVMAEAFAAVIDPFERIDRCKR